MPQQRRISKSNRKFSLLGKRRIDLNIGVSYGEDLEKVKKVTLNALKPMEALSEKDETTLFYDEFGGSSISFLLRIWINTSKQSVYLKVRSEAIMRLKKHMMKMIKCCLFLHTPSILALGEASPLIR